MQMQPQRTLIETAYGMVDIIANRLLGTWVLTAHSTWTGEHKRKKVGIFPGAIMVPRWVGKGNNRRRSYMHFPGGLNDAIRSTRYMLAHEELFPDQDIARRLYRSACQEVVEMGSQIMIVGNNDRDEDKVGIVGSVAAWKQAMRTVSAFSAYRFRNVADIIDAILGGELNVARGIDLCRANLSLVECEPFLGFANYIRSELGCVTHATVEGAINILEEVERECKFFAAKQGLEQSCAVLGEVRDRLRRKDAWAQSEVLQNRHKYISALETVLRSLHGVAWNEESERLIGQMADTIRPIRWAIRDGDLSKALSLANACMKQAKFLLG